MRRTSVVFEVPVTYRCNLGCSMCDRFLDLFPWNDSDVTVRDVRRAGRRVRAARIYVRKVKVTGGEPTLHPRLFELCEALRRWNKRNRKEFKLRVSTNDTTGYRFDRPRKFARVRRSPPSEKSSRIFRQYHKPVLVSPVDLGLERRTLRTCGLMTRCGRVFDAFGFTFCHMAGPLGRILHVDPYRSRPVLERDRAICRHCLRLLPNAVRYSVWKGVEEGRMEYPSPTFARALDRCRESGTMEFKRFRQRLREERRVSRTDA